MQQGGSLRQVQCTQLGGAVRNWEKGGSQSCSYFSPQPSPSQILLGFSSATGASNTPIPSPFTVSSRPHPARVPVHLTCGEEACERLTLLKASDRDHSHLIVSTWDQPLEFLGPGSAVYPHALWLP